MATSLVGGGYLKSIVSSIIITNILGEGSWILRPGYPIFSPLRRFPNHMNCISHISVEFFFLWVIAIKLFIHLLLVILRFLHSHVEVTSLDEDCSVCISLSTISWIIPVKYVSQHKTVPTSTWFGHHL